MTNSAVLVGINKYQNGNNLRGCCNDVDNIYSILVDTLKKFKFSDIIILKDEGATKENIENHLKEMVKRIEPKDYCFFSFSGHGSQVADADGDEADFKDELICPHDMNWGKKTYITDDELGEIFSGIPKGAWLEVILDSCHSGTATKEAGAFSDRLVKTCVSPHADLDLSVRRMRRAVRKVGNHVLWTACKDDQNASDAYLGGKFNGAFVYYWAKILRENPKILRHDHVKNVLSILRGYGFTQEPQLTVESSKRGS